MRYHWLALATLFVGTTLVFAQQPPAAPRPPDKLDDYLARWEKEMHNLQTLVVQCERTEKDKVFPGVDVYWGVFKFMKPNLASLEMVRKDKPNELAEKFICSGTYIYQFVFPQKEIHVHQLPVPTQGQVTDDGFLSFLLGMKAADARERYDLRLVKDDQWYIYVEVIPRTNADKADFQKARLVLNKDSFLPRQLWFEDRNGKEITWDILKVDTKGDSVRRTDFESPKVPTGWKMVQGPRTAGDAPPRVIRDQHP